MRKVCEDCHKSFECSNNRCVRCEECQEAYRKGYKDIWRTENEVPSNVHGQYYQFWRFCTTLTDDERRALVTKRINDLRYDTTDDEWKRLRTEIKILCQTYEGEKVEVYEMRNKERERLESVKRGVIDE